MDQPCANLEIHLSRGEQGTYRADLRLRGVARTEPRPLDPAFLPFIASADPQADGERLFRWLTGDEQIRRAWAELRREAPARCIHMHVDADAPVLHALPWELLRDPGGDAAQDLAASLATPFSRFLAVEAPPGRPQDRRPVKILAAIANPAGLDPFELEPINLQQELALLQEAARDVPDVQITFLDEPCTLPRLAAALRDGYHVLHFVGHAAFVKDKATLFLADDAGQVCLVDEDEFAGMLARQLGDQDPQATDGLRLVFLASCQTATRSTADAHRGLAPRLVRTGLPAVLAMQDRVGVETARGFASVFYRRLLRHGLVDLAANEARAALLAARLPGASIPVLFMRLEDGRLLDVALGPDQERAYLKLLDRTYAHWQELYVRQEADRLHPAQESPRRVGRFPHRSYEHVQERYGLLTRERLQGGLLDWLLANRQMALLAVPGCGKSTALEELAWEVASRQLADPAADLPLPVLVSLGSCRQDEPWPDFLPRAVREGIVRSLVDWDSREPDREDAELAAWQMVRPVVAAFDYGLEQLRRRGRLLLLLDGLNELRGGAEGPLRSTVHDFVVESLGWGNRVVVTCRVAEYAGYIGQLNRVELLPFDAARIQQALEAYLGKDEGDLLWSDLARPANRRLQDMLAIPLYVEMLGEEGVLARDEQGRLHLPANRGAMLARFAWALMARERLNAEHSGRPVVAADVQCAALAAVAFRMRHDLSSRGSQVPLPQAYSFLVEALAAYPDCRPEWVRDLAAGAKLVDIDVDANGKPTSLSFWKEPLEEYFAARHLLQRFASGEIDACQALWRVPLRREEVRQGQTTLGEPPQYPLTSGAWEETTILAAGLADAEEPLVSADRFVEAVLAVNPALAGRCLHEGGAQVSGGVRGQVAQRLLAVMQAPDYAVSVRTACGVVLGRLGDPRFHGPALFGLPQEPLLGFVEAPAGPFRMGSDRRTVAQWNRKAEEAGAGANLYDDELGNAREVDIPYRYWMARYPATNSQYRCFVAAGGYTPRWRHCWTEAGRVWLEGERWNDEMDQRYRQLYDYWRQRGEYADYDTYPMFLEQLLWPFFDRMRKDRPDEWYWADPAYNAPTQPVVGLTWYEAVAYANWLDAALRETPGVPARLRELLAGGCRVCLPSEAEWEKAARGGLRLPASGGNASVRRWPWQPTGPAAGGAPNPAPARQWPWEGERDPGRCNSAEGEERVGWISPVGMFPAGASPYGCQDLVGNVWEWTRSAYRAYPCVVQPADGQDEAELAPLRVVRGGCWYYELLNARCAVRDWDNPFNMDSVLGVRVVCAPSRSDF